MNYVYISVSLNYSSVGLFFHLEKHVLNLALHQALRFMYDTSSSTDSLKSTHHFHYMALSRRVRVQELLHL